MKLFVDEGITLLVASDGVEFVEGFSLENSRNGGGRSAQASEPAARAKRQRRAVALPAQGSHGPARRPGSLPALAALRRGKARLRLRSRGQDVLPLRRNPKVAGRCAGANPRPGSVFSTLNETIHHCPHPDSAGPALWSFSDRGGCLSLCRGRRGCAGRLGVPGPGEKLRRQPAARRRAGGHCRALCRQLRLGPE